MKTQVIALALFVLTAGILGFYPVEHDAGANPGTTGGGQVNGGRDSGRPKVDVVFVLDTTGSMGGMIEAAKEKIWSIVSSMAAAQPTPEIRMGLVAYRDRGDAYVTRIYDLSTDLDSIYVDLMDFQANGGGDGPESVNQALHDAVHKMSWSQDVQAYRVLFLVGDAPPHMDYQDDVPYQETLVAAQDKGITVNTIQCGRDGTTRRQWETIAQLANGRYFQVEQNGSAVAIATPFDESLAKLSKTMDDTRLYYGGVEEKKRQNRKLEATAKLHEASSDASRARRAAFNASAAGESNFLGEGELVEDIAAGRVKLGEIEQDELPAPLQALSPADREVLVKESGKRRVELRQEIERLSMERADFLEQKLESMGGARASLDDKIFATVREQANKKGLEYDVDVPVY